MNENNEQDHEPRPDRDIPSIATVSKHQYIIMGVFGVLAIVAMFFVVMNGMKKNTPPSFIAPEKIAFKGNASSSTPYIQAEPKESLAPTQVKPAQPSAASDGVGHAKRNGATARGAASSSGSTETQ